MSKRLGILIIAIAFVLVLVIALNIMIGQQESKKTSLPAIKEDVPAQETEVKEDTRAFIQEESGDANEVFSGPLLN